MSVGRLSQLRSAADCDLTCRPYAGQASHCRSPDEFYARFHRRLCPSLVPSLSHCRGRRELPRSAWLSQRVGPFNTTGGHSFTHHFYDVPELAGAAK